MPERRAQRHFPNAKKIVLVQDNLNTHKPASLCEARPVERFEWHYTPKHGSWLDMAESELAVLLSQCLDRRIPDKRILIHQVAAWQADRNTHHAKADWHFTTDCGRQLVAWFFVLTATAYNLVRIPKILAATG